MAATVLGKRSRSAAEPEGKAPSSYFLPFRSILTSLVPGLPVRTASKRRTVAPPARREDAAVPNSIPRTRSRAKIAEPLTDQENGDVIKPSDKTLSKHTSREEQGGSPSKINSHFRTSKLVEGKLREREVCARVKGLG
jgi:cell division control protein 6